MAQSLSRHLWACHQPLRLVCSLRRFDSFPFDLGTDRVELLQQIVTFATDRCHSMFANDGYPFTLATRLLSEDVAVGLMSRATDSPYAFLDSDVTALANDGGQLAETWPRQTYEACKCN